MIQQHLTVEGLYLRKKHPELAAGQRPFYIWRKSKVKDQDALRCLAFINTESDQKPATVSQAFCFMVSPHNSPFTSILLATPLSAFLPAAQAATAGWVLYPPSSHTSDPVNPQAGLKSPSLSPRRKTQWQVSSPSLRGRDNRPWIGRKAGMSQGQGRGTKYSCPLHPCTSKKSHKGNRNTHTKKGPGHTTCLRLAPDTGDRGE